MTGCTDKRSGETAGSVTTDAAGSASNLPFEQPSIAVIEAVVTATNRDPIDLPCLHDFVDPDALDALVSTGSADRRVSVSFDYDGLEVTVDSVDGIELRAPSGDGD